MTFSFDSSGNNPVTAAFPYTNHFFIDAITGITYYIDDADNAVEAISYLPETTQYAFTAADGNTYLIHYNDVRVVFPVISGANVNAGVATVGADTFTVDIDEVDPTLGGPAIPINRNSFEINGNLYTIAGTPVGADYSSCTVVGDAARAASLHLAEHVQAHRSRRHLHAAARRGEPARLDHRDVPGPAEPRPDHRERRHVRHHLQHGEHRLAAGPGAGVDPDRQLRPSRSPIPSTPPRRKFIFADLDIYDAASVVGQFTVYLAPTFFIGGATYTLDPVQLVVTDNNKRPYPLLPNPTMFSINGFNYVIDTNRVPHAIVGNNNVSPLATDVTVESGQPIPHSTFTLNGQIYAYTEDARTTC